MKRIVLILVTVLLGIGLFAQVPKVNQNVYGIRVKNAINRAIDTVNATYVDVSAVVDTNDVQTVILNDHESRVDHLEGDSVELGWFNVVDYGAVGDSLQASASANVTAFRAAITAADNSKIFIPQGTYYFNDSIYFTKSLIFEGSGNNKEGLATRLVSIINKPLFYQDSVSTGSGGYGVGSTFRDINFVGCGSGDSTRQWAIIINANKRNRFEHCTFQDWGAGAIKFGDTYQAVNNTVYDCHIYSNEGTSGALYGKKNESVTVNAIDIERCHIYDNRGHGIEISGKDIQVINNVIEFQDSSGIMINGTTEGEQDCYIDGMLIARNFFEDNGGGNIFGWHAYTSESDDQLIYHCKIIDNVFSTAISYDKPEASAQIVFKQHSTGTSGSRLHDVYIGENRYLTSNSTPSVDLGGDGSGGCRNDVKVWVPQITAPATYFLNLDNASVEFEGSSTPGPNIIYSITAGTGITQNDLSRLMRLSMSAAVDITANPQIANGWHTGQLITIVGNNDTNTLTLDDGNGLNLTGQIVLGQDDNITLMYIENDWIEISRSSN